jgi:hypothetical protein
MNANIFNVDFNTLVVWLTPRRLRKQKILALVKLFAIPFIYLHQDFLRFRKAKRYELSITPSKCLLELLLNDQYDFAARRIYIDDGQDKPPTYIFRSDELKPLFIYTQAESRPKTIYTAGESGDYRDDFVVYVPLDIVFEMAEMISLLKMFKLLGTKFKIQRF